MKIGILTYHKSHNYGALLQAIATRHILQGYGHEVSFVDYWPKYRNDGYALFSFKKLFSYHSLKPAINYLLKTIRFYGIRKTRKNKFQSFISKFIQPYCTSTEDSYDLLIYGSDQIWAKKSELKDYDAVYFAKNNIKTNRHVAFSASMGILPNNAIDIEKTCSLFSNFESLSVREEDLLHFLKTHGFQNAKLTLDPTLLIPRGTWEDIFDIPATCQKPYVLVYALNGNFDHNEVNAFAEKNGLEVKYILGEAKQIGKATVIATADPLDFLRLVKNASIILSSSSHGLAFSIIFKKEFFVSFESNAMRAKTLLKAAGLSERFITPYSQIPESYTPINYNEVFDNLSPLINESKSFLKSNSF